MKYFTNKDIGEYYNTTMSFYWLYHLNSNGIHFGFSDSSTRGIRDAILNTNKFLAHKVGIKSGDRILDAGCGIGGSAVWLARKYKKIHVTGISLAPNQIKKAVYLSQRESVDNRTAFLVMDYFKTSFKNNSFDVVWAIESVCYAPKKIDFLKEAYRVLKPGGRLVVSDGFLYRKPKTTKEKKVMNTFYTGYRLNSIPTFGEFKKDIIRVGFRHISLSDMSKSIRPSMNRAYYLGKLGYPIAWLGCKLNLFSKTVLENAGTAIAQKEGFSMGLGGYGVFYAKKP